MVCSLANSWANECNAVSGGEDGVDAGEMRFSLAKEGCGRR
jgi:hypothetical protein